MTDEKADWSQLKVNMALVLRGDITELKELVSYIDDLAAKSPTLKLLYKMLSAERLNVSEAPRREPEEMI